MGTSAETAAAIEAVQQMVKRGVVQPEEAKALIAALSSPAPFVGVADLFITGLVTLALTWLGVRIDRGAPQRVRAKRANQ
jgi:hypothetical protein